MLKQKICGLCVCFALGLAVMACTSTAGTPKGPDIYPPTASQDFGAGIFVNTLKAPKGPFARVKPPQLTARVREKHALNSDSVGWLQVPGTTIDDVVLWYPHDVNEFYYRRNFEKRESFNGSYYADYRCTFDGTAKGLSPNTVIYGHSMSDDPNDPRGLFSPLKLYWEEKYARENPYIYFSTMGEDHAWEIFAVFFSTDAMPYNIPAPGNFEQLVAECKKLSIHDFNVPVTSDDKILTLSTCIYHDPVDWSRLPYPNEHRYAIMAKLVK